MSLLGIPWIAGLLLVSGMDVVPPLSGPEASSSDLRIGLPGRGWSLWIHPVDFEFGPPMPGPTEDTVWASGDAIEPGLSITVLLRARPAARDAAECLARMSGRAGVGSCGDRGVFCAEHVGMAILEYRIEGHAAVPFDQGHLLAYLYHDGVCGEIHLTKTDYRRRDRKTFLRLLESVEHVTTPVTGTELSPSHSD